MRIRTLLPILVATAVHSFAGTITDTIPENTTIVIRADYSQLRNSIIATEIIDKNLEQFTAAMEGIKSATGVDLDDVDRMWLLAEKENHGTIVLEGKMNAESIRAQIGKNADVQFTEKDGFDLYAEYTEQKQSKVLAARDGLALAGNRDYTLSLLASMTGTGTSVTDNPALNTLAADTNHVAVAMLRVNDELRSKNPDIAALLKTGNMGLSVSDTVTANLALETNAPDQAEGLQMMAQGMIALQMVKMQQMITNSDQHPAQKVREASVMISLLKTLKIAKDGATVTADWNLSADAHKQVKEALAAQKEAEAPIAVP